MSKFKAISKVPAYQLVEESIRAMILGGDLAPGHLLPPETELAEQLEVTRPTVREAFRSLEGAGLIKRGPRRRMMVIAPSPGIVHTAMREAIVLHGVTHQELWEVSMALEPATAGLAATKISPEILEEIEENLERTAACLDKPEELAARDLEFHDLVAKAADNHAILLAREPLSDLLLPESTFVALDISPGKRLLEAHTNIFKALKSGDEEQARDWMSKHIRDGRRDCEQAGIDLNAPINIRNRNPS